MPSANLNRRALFAGAAAVASAAGVAFPLSAAPVAQISDQATDPIFEAMRRYTAAARAVDLAAGDAKAAAGDQGLSAALASEADLRMELAGTVPTTLAGLMALATFLDEESRELDTAFLDGDFRGETSIFFAALHRSVAALAGRPLASDGDQDAELMQLCRKIEKHVAAVAVAKEREKLAWATYRSRMPAMPRTLRWSEQDEDRMMTALERDENGFYSAAAVKRISAIGANLKGGWSEWINNGADAYDQLRSKGKQWHAARVRWSEKRAEQIRAAWREWQAARDREKASCEVEERMADHCAAVAELAACVERLQGMEPVTIAGMRARARWRNTRADRDEAEVGAVAVPAAA